MKQFWIVLLLTLISLSAVSLGLVSANDGDNPYYTVQTFAIGDGKLVDQTIINGPPKPLPGYELERAPVTLPEINLTLGNNTLNVPAYDWFFGCSATSGAMIAAYYDLNGYPNMYTGPTNGGVMPMTNDVWLYWVDDNGYSYGQCPLTASRLGLDGRASRGSIDDYWVEYGSGEQDPYLTNGWTQHTWGDAIGDFMKTSQYYYNNVDGETSFYTWSDSPTQLTCADMNSYGIANQDGTYGRKLFYEAKGYMVTDCYNQKTDNNGGGFTYAMYKAEIDSGRPVMVNLDGHTVVGIGYSDPSTIFINDTWDYSTHSMTWGGSYDGMSLDSVSIVNLKPLSTGGLSGIVSDEDNSTPIVGANILAGGTAQTTSGEDGRYSLSLPTGVYAITASASKYYTRTVTGVSISPNITTTLNLNLGPFQALQYTPVKLQAQTIPGGRMTIPLKLTIGSDSPVAYTLEEVIGGYQPPMASTLQSEIGPSIGSTTPDSRRAPIEALLAYPASTIQGVEDALLDEGFEGGVIPPAGWSEIETNKSQNWKIIMDDYLPYSNYAADVEYDPNLETQDEWLVSPIVNLSQGTLTFWSLGSLYWCRDTYDNCDLNVWLIVGDVGGSDDIFVGKGDNAWGSNFTWSQSVFNLTPFLPGSSVRIGFEYSGKDGAEICLDGILLEGSDSIPWLFENPVTGSVSVTQNRVIDITFDASAISQIGVYTGTLHILSKTTTTPDQSVPVIMNVVTPIKLYLPVIQR